MNSQCWLRAHVDLLHHAPGRLYLRCTECGRETPGWTLDRPVPRARFLGREREEGFQNKDEGNKVRHGEQRLRWIAAC
jgi:hypothetical protein